MEPQPRKSQPAETAAACAREAAAPRRRSGSPLCAGGGARLRPTGVRAAPTARRALRFRVRLSASQAARPNARGAPHRPALETQPARTSKRGAEAAARGQRRDRQRGERAVRRGSHRRAQAGQRSRNAHGGGSGEHKRGHGSTTAPGSGARSGLSSAVVLSGGHHPPPPARTRCSRGPLPLPNRRYFLSSARQACVLPQACGCCSSPAHERRLAAAQGASRRARPVCANSGVDHTAGALSVLVLRQRAAPTHDFANAKHGEQLYPERAVHRQLRRSARSRG